MNSGYLERLERRRERDALERDAVFGIGIGFILLVVGTFERAFVVASNETLWTAVQWIGGTWLATGVLLPQSFSLLNRGWRWVSQKVGHVAFLALLSIAYFAIIWPVGAWLRKRKGRAPIYAWESGHPVRVEGWVDKDPVLEFGPIDPKARIARAYILRHPISVLVFFARRNQLILLPGLLLLLVLGLILFFVQSSSLAPLIYTLF